MLRTLLFLGAIGYVSAIADYDDLLAEEAWLHRLKVSVINTDQLRSIVIDRKHCSNEETVWKCREECRRTFMSGNETIPGLCRKPIPGDVCFGSPVDYAYVSNDHPFPLAYKVLENYPKCWSYLAPLMCAVHFRPCAMHKYALKREDQSVEEGITELWATVRRGFCRQTVSACSDVIRDGFFPEFLSCDNSNSTFSDDCRISNLPVPFAFASKCPKPLVFVEGVVDGAMPLHDSCYLQCGADHVGRMRENQHKYQGGIGCVLALVFALAFAYLHFFSAIHSSSAVVFCAAQSLLSIAGFHALWGLSPFTASDVDCIEAGGHLLRATEPNRHFLQWCATQGVLLHFFLTSAFFWIAALSILSLCKPRCLKTEKIHSFHLRSLLVLCIYLPACIYSLIIQLFHLQETDGVSGVCLTGLLSSERHAIVVAPPLMVSLIAAIVSLTVYWRRARQFRNSAMTSTVDFGQRLEEYNRRRKRDQTQKEQMDTTENGENGQSDEKKLILAEDGQEFDPELEWGATRPTGPHMGSYTADGFLDREYRAFLEKKSIFNTAEGEVSDDFYKKTAEQYTAAVAQNFGPYRIVWYNSFGLCWPVAAILSAVVVLLLSLSLHPTYIAVDSHLEKSTVQSYVRCAVDASISRGSIEWAHGNRSEEAFSSCQLDFYLPAGRDSHVVLFYLILPSIPFLLLVTSMVAGFCGHGGMKNIRATRWKGFETVQEPDEEDLPFKKVPLCSNPSPQCFSVADTTEPEEPGREASTEPSVENGGGEVENKTEAPTQAQTPESGTKTPPESTGLGTSKQNLVVEEEVKDEEEEAEAGDTLSALPVSLDFKKLRGKKPSKRAVEEHHRRFLAQLVKKIAHHLEHPELPVPDSMNDLMALFRDAHGRGRAKGLSSQKVKIFTVHQIYQIVQEFVNRNQAGIIRTGTAVHNVAAVLIRSLQLYDVIFVDGEPATGDVARAAVTELMGLAQTAGLLLPELQQHLVEVTDWLNCNGNAHTLLVEADYTLMNRGPPSERERHNAQIYADSGNTTPQVQFQPSDFAVFERAPALVPAVQQFQQNGNQAPQAARQAHPAPVNIPPVIHAQPREQEQKPQQGPLPVITLPPALRAKVNQAQQPQHNFSGFQGFGAAPARQQPQQVVPQQLAPQQVQPQQGQPQQAVPQQDGHAFNRALRHLEALRQQGAAAGLRGPHIPQLQQRPGPSGSGRQPQLNQDQPCSSRQGVAQPPQRQPIVFQSRTSNLISPYAEAYNPAPLGLITSFSDDEISVRVSRMREFNSMQLFPQDFIYTLVLTGDVRVAVQDDLAEGERVIPTSAFPELFGRAPGIESRHEPASFLRYMRRRAIIIATTIGFHYKAAGRNDSYVPPVLPDLGFIDLDEISLIRVVGAPAVFVMRTILADFQYGDRPLQQSLHLPEVGAFAAYLDHFASTMGFPHSREDIIPDPGPPTPPRPQPTADDEFIHSLSDHEDDLEEDE